MYLTDWKSPVHERNVIKHNRSARFNRYRKGKRIKNYKDFIEIPEEELIDISSLPHVINEMKAYEIRDEVDIKSKQRAGVLETDYLRVTNRGYIYYRTTSATVKPGGFWYQSIKIKGLEDAFYAAQSKQELIDFMRNAELEVHCDCPAYKYWGYQYIATKLGFAIQSEDRYPNTRNPNLNGTVCKHLYNVLRVHPFNIPKIVSDIWGRTIRF